MTFAKNDSNGSILEIKKFGKPPIQGQAQTISVKTSTRNNKKKGLRIGSSNNSPIPIELIGADGLRSSKNKKKKFDQSVKSGYMPSYQSMSPRQNSHLAEMSLTSGQLRNSLNVKKSTH